MLIEWWWCVGVLIQWIRENKASEMRAISHWSWPATTTTGESLRLVLARICSVGDVVLYYTYPWPVSRLDWPLAFRRTVFDIISKRRKTMQHPWHFKLKHTHRSHSFWHAAYLLLLRDDRDGYDPDEQHMHAMQHEQSICPFFFREHAMHVFH
jgi:hypothetical protein